MTTFNIDLVGKIIYDPSFKYSNTKFGPVYKLKLAYETLKERADATWKLFCDTVASTGKGFRNADYALLRSVANKLKTLYGVTVDVLQYKQQIVEAEPRGCAPYDSYCLSEVREELERLDDPVTRHMHLVASAGVTIEQWQDVKDVREDVLVLKSGKQYPLTADEADVLLKCWHTSDAYDEFVGLLDTHEVAEGDKNHRLFVHMNNHRGQYTYGQLLFVWELNRYLTNGLSDVSEVVYRTGVSEQTCEAHPEQWLFTGKISQETYNKLM